MIDIASNTLLATISVSPQPIDIAISPDGSKAYVTGCDPNFTSGTLTVIDVATNVVSATTVLAGHREIQNYAIGP